MYENLKGKRLLFLGAVRPLCEPVKIAKEMGINTIVIDYLPDSPAKKVADEAYLVSTTNVDEVVKLCKEKHVDGVFTAFIDSMLPYAREICDRLKFPFYASKEQIRMSLDKRFFKETCLKYGVPVPNDYTNEIKERGIDVADIDFPVIVKPVDSSGGRGVRICNSRKELQEAYDYAMSISPGKNVLVEECLIGDEVTATYTMKNGEISLSGFKDKLISLDHENITSQMDVLIFPSRYLRCYVDIVNPHVTEMLKGMNATDGTVFFQGKATNDRIAFFECGFRPNGAHDYRHIERINGINFIKMMIAHSLTGNMDGYELSQDNPFFSKYILNLNIYAHGGTIGELSGLESILSIQNVLFAEYMHDEGETLVDNNTLSQCVFRALITDSNIKQIQNTIKEIQRRINVKDVNGNNMLYLPFDVNRLDKYPKEIS